MCKECGFSTDIVNFHNVGSTDFVLKNFITWTHCQEHTSFIMQGCAVICKFTVGLREIKCFVIMESCDHACGMSRLVMTMK